MRFPFLRTGRFIILMAAMTHVVGTDSVQAQKPDRSERPPLGPVPNVNLPDAKRFALENGLDIVLVEKREVPLVQINLLVRAGAAYDAPAQVGLASLTAEMLDEGAGGRSALDLADAFERLGARFNVNAGRHLTTVSLRAPVSRLDDALTLMRDVVLRPDFPADELDRKRDERLTALIRRHDEPNAIADALLRNVVFGRDHPYGRPAIGNEQFLRQVVPGHLRAFHAAHYVPNAATFVVVGGIDTAAARQAIDRAFGDWQRNAAPELTLTEPMQVSGRVVYIVDKPGAVQSVIAIGRVGVTRDNPDYYALEVMNTILGGSFTSRLNQNLREDKGYTYGAGSGFDYGLVKGSFSARASVQTQSTGPAIAEFLKEFRGMHEPIPTEEFERARNNLATGFIQGFQSVAQIAAQLGDVREYDLPPEWLEEWVGRITAVTPTGVARVVNEAIQTEDLAIIVVGDRSQIEEQIRALDIGSIRVLSVTDVLGPVPVMGRSTS
jgi:predicted Zn-dependent peptidase